MKAFMFLVILSMAMTAMCLVQTDDGEMEDDEEALTVEDFYEYFEMANMDFNAEVEVMEVEKRATKVGSCTSPDGIFCELCNLKVRNKQSRKRYLLCTGGKSKGSKGL